MRKFDRAHVLARSRACPRWPRYRADFRQQREDQQHHRHRYPATYKVVRDIKVSRRPRDMHFNADHSKLYVACGDDDVIDILESQSCRWSPSSRPGRAPKPSPSMRSAAEFMSPTKKVFARGHRMDRNAIVKEVPTGVEPEGVLISERQEVYVTSETGDLVHEDRCRQQQDRARRGGGVTAAAARGDARRQGSMGDSRARRAKWTLLIAPNSSSPARSRSCRRACARST